MVIGASGAMSSIGIAKGGMIRRIEASQEGNGATHGVPSGPSFTSACSWAGVSPITDVNPLTIAALAACQEGLGRVPARSAGALVGAGVSLPPIRLGVPYGAVLGEDSIWLIPPSPTAADAHVAHTFSTGCRHPHGSAGPCDATATAGVVVPASGQGRVFAKRPRTAATASEVQEQMRRDSAAKRLRSVGAAPWATPAAPPTLASLLLDALEQDWALDMDDELMFQPHTPPAQPCHSAASSAESPPPPNAAVLPHGPTARALAPPGTHAAATLPYAVAQHYIQSYAQQLGWEVVGPETALQPLY